MIQAGGRCTGETGHDASLPYTGGRALPVKTLDRAVDGPLVKRWHGEALWTPATVRESGYNLVLRTCDGHVNDAPS